MENAKPHCIFHEAPVKNISTQRPPEADPIMVLDFPPETPTSKDLSDCFNLMHNYL